MAKKTYLLIAAAIMLFTSLTAEAQRSHWGVVIGGNYNEIHFKQQDIFNVDRGFGGTAGLMGELMVPGVGFGFEAQLLYTLRSGTFHMEDRRAWSSLGLGKERVMLHYIDVPISLKFKYRNMNGFENTLAPLIYAGPVFSFLVGHSKVGDQLRYDHLNIGLRIGVGVELFSRVQISGNYTFSVGEALRTKLLEEHSAKNRCWTITAVYLF